MHVFINDRMSAHDFFFFCICVNVAASFGTETPLEWFTDTLIYSIEEAFFLGFNVWRLCMFGLSYNEKNKQKNKSSQYFIIFRPTAVDLFYTT